MRQIKCSTILEMLEDGKNRKAIKEELGLSIAEAKVIFSHPTLKNKKPKKQVNIELIDDTTHSSSETLEQYPTTSGESYFNHQGVINHLDDTVEDDSNSLPESENAITPKSEEKSKPKWEND